MKVSTWRRLTALLLCIVMLLGLFVTTAPKAYAAETGGETATEPTWPHLKSIDSTGYTFSNEKLRSDFPAPSENLKKIEIQHSEKKKCENAISEDVAYDVGTIVLYVATLPTENDKYPESAGYCGFKFQIKRNAVENKLVQFSGDYETIGNFGVSQKLKVSEGLYFHPNTAYYYIQTKDRTKYHYDIQVVQYTGETGEKLTLSGGSATRTSKGSATVKFNASATGSYYYALYDQQQTAPMVDITSANENTGTMAKTNTITISDLTDYGKKYLYVVGVDAAGNASDPLEIVIPCKTFKLLHNKQGLRGFTTINSSEDETIVASWLYTEEFKDASGKTISEAAVGDTVTVNFGVFPPDAVSSIDDICYDSATNAIKDTTDIRRHVLKRWNINGVDVSPGTSTSFTFTMPENDVTIQAETELSGVPVYLTSASETISANLQCYALNKNSATFNEPLCYYRDKRDCVVAGTKVKLSASNIPEAYLLGKWQITNNGVAVDKSKITYDQNNNPILTLEEGGNYVFTATFLEKSYARVTAGVNDSKMGTATVAIADGEASSSAYPVYEGQTVTLTATPGNKRYLLENWEVKDAGGTVIGVTKDETDLNKATFTMPATGKDITAKAIFKVDSAYASTEKELISVALCSADGKQLGTVSALSTAWTITLPADTDTSKLGELTLKLTASEYATITKSGDETAMDWASGQPCGMTLNEAATFTVTAENGDTQDYTITIKQEAAPNAPTLSDGSATRIDNKSATVTFTSSEAGKYFYSVVNDNAAAPDIATTGSGDTASAGSNSFTLPNLTESASSIYIVVKNTSGVESAPLKVDIPAYGDSTVPDTGNFTVSVTAPKGGTLTTNRTKANKGDEIIVTVTPDSGYQMVEGSLTYSLAVAGGETVKITGNRFTMPAGSVTITCKWETATVSAKGITAFTINGVSAAVNNTTNVITITLPRGTDVTKLTPVISTSGVKSLSPASGKTVDFTNSVTYTATMDDGSTKTYTVTVYVDKGSLADQFWDKLTDFYNQTPWWQYAEHQQSTKKYPKYW